MEELSSGLSSTSHVFFIQSKTKSCVSSNIKGSVLCIVLIHWQHISLWLCVHTKVLLCVPCWSRWWLHPPCRKAAPGCVCHCERVQQRSICWCRTSPSPHSPSPQYTPSSTYLWVPDGNSADKQERCKDCLSLCCFFPGAVKWQLLAKTLYFHVSASLWFCSSHWLCVASSLATKMLKLSAREKMQVQGVNL